jgi:hypothetical protein
MILTGNASSNGPIGERAEAIAADLVQCAAGAAFSAYRKERFRELADIERLSQTEQDRIFNELVVSYLVLVLLVLEAPDLSVAEDSRGSLSRLKERIPEAYLDYLRNVGVESKYIRDWKRLIEMRYREYARDKHDVRAAAMHIESGKNGLDLDSLSKIQMVVPLQTVAIGCHHHICRGRPAGRDELFKATLQSLSRFYVELRLRLEGRRVSALARLRLAVNRMVRHIRP